MVTKLQAFSIILLFSYLILVGCAELDTNQQITKNVVIENGVGVISESEEETTEGTVAEMDNDLSSSNSPLNVENPEKEDCPYECCMSTNYKKKICNYDRYCEDNNCKKFECTADYDCEGNESCSEEYVCESLSCPEGEYADNHQCIQNECYIDKDCPKIQCNDDHVCKPIEMQCIAHVCKLIEPVCGEYRVMGTGFCWIYNETQDLGYLIERVKKCGAELVDFDPMVEEITITSIYIFDNCEEGAINALFEIYNDGEPTDYYTVKIKDESVMEVITITTSGENLKELKDGAITKDEFFNRALRSTHQFIPTPYFINYVNW